MNTPRRVGFVCLAVAIACGAFPPTALQADKSWPDEKRKTAREAAGKAVEEWAAAVPFPFRLRADAYMQEKRPKHGGPLYKFYPEHYGRCGVLQIHPYDLDVSSGIEARVKIPPEATSLRFVVRSHDRPGTDIGCAIRIDGKEVFSETLKTEGEWRTVRVPVKEFAGCEVGLRVDAFANGWNFEFLFIDTIDFAGHLFTADTGRISLTFEQFGPYLVHVGRSGRRLGAVGFGLGEFEKRGIGYKKTGVGLACANNTKSIRIVESGPARCVVEVTAERTESEETKRSFEAVCRFVACKGEPWFDVSLLSLKNTDKTPYALRGYDFRLQPGSGKAAPAGFPDCAGVVFVKEFLGAMVSQAGDFCLSMRSSGQGDFVRRLQGDLRPSASLSGLSEPSLRIFVGEPGTGKALFTGAWRISNEKGAPQSTAPMSYHEEKGEARK